MSVYIVAFITAFFSFLVGIIWYHDAKSQYGLYDSSEFYYLYHSEKCYSEDYEDGFNDASILLYHDAEDAADWYAKGVEAIFFSAFIFCTLAIILLSCKFIKFEGVKAWYDCQNKSVI